MPERWLFDCYRPFKCSHSGFINYDKNSPLTVPPTGGWPNTFELQWKWICESSNSLEFALGNRLRSLLGSRSSRRCLDAVESRYWSRWFFQMIIWLKMAKRAFFKKLNLIQHPGCIPFEFTPNRVQWFQVQWLYFQFSDFLFGLS